MQSKQCTKCLVEKSVSEFSKRSKTKWVSHCKECKRKGADLKAANIRSKAWYQQNKERKQEYDKEYRKINKEHILKSRRSYHREYAKGKRAVDINYRIASNLRARIRSAIYGTAKSEHTVTLLGCTIEEFRLHLESLFTDGMSWSNYGRDGWHIDHIKPCAAFDMSKDDEQRRCFHYTNMQPLWAIDNLKKSDKF